MDDSENLNALFTRLREKANESKTSGELESLLNEVRQLLKTAFQTEYEDEARELFREIRSRLDSHESASSVAIKSFESSEQPHQANRDEIQLLTEARRKYYAGDYYEAVDLLSKVLQIDPENSEARDRLAQAENNINRGIVPESRVPFEARSAFGRAQSLERAGKFEEAREFYNLASEEARKGGIEKWEPVTEALLRIENSLIASTLREEGNILLQKDNWLAAIEKYQASLRLSPDYYEVQNIIEILREAQEKTELLSIISINWQSHSFQEVDEIVSRLTSIAYQLPSSQRLKHSIGEGNSLRDRIREYEFLQNILNGIQEAEVSLLSGDSCTAWEILLRILKHLPTDFKIPEFVEKLEELHQRADKLRVSAAILCAERIASEGGYARAKRILESNSENEDTRKALEKVTARQNHELETLAVQRKEYLDELRYQSDVWFKWGVRASILGAVLLIVGAVGIFINQIPSSAVVTISSLLPSAFAKFFIDQYRELRKERLSLLSKKPEEEKLEMDAQRQRIGLNEQNAG